MVLLRIALSSASRRQLSLLYCPPPWLEYSCFSSACIVVYLFPASLSINEREWLAMHIMVHSYQRHILLIILKYFQYFLGIMKLLVPNRWWLARMPNAGTSKLALFSSRHFFSIIFSLFLFSRWRWQAWVVPMHEWTRQLSMVLSRRDIAQQ